MPKKKQVQRAPRHKPLIVVDAKGFNDERGRLFRIIEERGWQPFDLSLSRYYFPTNPAPSGAIISSRLASRHSPFRQKTLDFPAVYVGGDTNRKEYGSMPAVLLNRAQSGAMAVDHLLERGFKHILVITQNRWSSVANPFKGARQRAEERGLAFHIHQLLTLDNESPEDKHARWVNETEKVIRALPKPLACIAINDFLGAKLCFDCQSYGLSVPEEIAIIGFGNQEFVCKSSPVPLTSVDWNYKLAFQTAVDILEKLLTGGQIDSPPILIPPKGVITRRSTDILAVEESRVSRAIRFMWDHLDWPLTLEDIARDVGVSRRTLARLFKQHLGRGINEELRRKRLETCCELLRSSDAKIDTISKKVGFPSTPHLNRTFKSHYGMTPSQYRAQKK